MSKNAKIQCDVSPGDGLGMFAYRDQWSIFCVLNFKNLYFGGTSHSWCILSGCETNAVFLSVSYF